MKKLLILTSLASVLCQPQPLYCAMSQEAMNELEANILALNMNKLEENILALNMKDDSDREYAINLMSIENDPAVGLTKRTSEEMRALYDYAHQLQNRNDLSANDQEIVKLFLTIYPLIQLQKNTSQPNTFNWFMDIYELEKEKIVAALGASAENVKLEALEHLHKTKKSELAAVTKKQSTTSKKAKDFSELTEKKSALTTFVDKLYEEITTLRKKLNSQAAQERMQAKNIEANILSLSMEDDSNREYAINLMSIENDPVVGLTNRTSEEMRALYDYAHQLQNRTDLSANDQATIALFITAHAPVQPKKNTSKPNTFNWFMNIYELEKEKTVAALGASAENVKLEALERLHKTKKSELAAVTKKQSTTGKKAKDFSELTEKKRALTTFVDKLYKEITTLRQKLNSQAAQERMQAKKAEACPASLQRKPVTKIAFTRAPIKRSLSLSEVRQKLEHILPMPRFLLTELENFETLNNEDRYYKIIHIADIYHNFLLGSTDAERMYNTAILQEMKDRMVYAPEKDGLIIQKASLDALNRFKDLTPNFIIVRSYIELYIIMFGQVTVKEDIDAFIDHFMQNDCVNFAKLDYTTIDDRGMHIANGLLNIYEHKEPMFQLLLDPVFHTAVQQTPEKDIHQKIADLKKATDRLEAIAKTSAACADRLGTLQDILTCTGIWAIPGLHNQEDQRSLVNNQLLLLERINYYAGIHFDVYTEEELD